MLARRRHPRFTLEQYLEWELDHEERFEYVDGLIVAMAGGSPRHNVVALNAASELRARFGDRCFVAGSDQRVATPDGLHTYPDAVVACGKPEFIPYKGTGTLRNPCVLVEVLSPSTRDYDLGEKLERYQDIGALRDVLLIDPDSVDVRHVRRTERGWETLRIKSIDDTIELADGSLAVAALYTGADRVEG